MPAQPTAADGVIVTGAAGLIGRAIVAALVADGFRVAAVDRADPAPHFADDIDKGRVVPITADLADAGARADLAAAARQALGRVRALVNNAADLSEQPLLESTDEQWRATLEINLVAPASLVRLLADDLADGGVVVNISSVRGLRCLPGAAAYEASKSGLLALTRTIAGELGHRGTRAVTVCPGAIVEDPDTWLDGTPQSFADAWTAAHPMGRAGGAAAVASVVAFLCSDAARHVNGVELVVDGGVMAQYPAAAALRLAGQLHLP
ncbi:MAG: hypothetical protein QOK43_2824 [Acidimicrobiaceae bacterium]|nr:hypothetical protein [Acidimicrobiaceae bacterium]